MIERHYAVYVDGLLNALFGDDIAAQDRFANTVQDVTGQVKLLRIERDGTVEVLAECPEVG